jgi:predicted DNA-binding transcriptional regulator AlpA
VNTAHLQALLERRPKGDRLMSAREIQAEAGVGETFFYETLVTDPAWPVAVRFGGCVLWWRSEILAYFEAKRSRRAPAADGDL